jgi:hypothetical protein
MRLLQCLYMNRHHLTLNDSPSKSFLPNDLYRVEMLVQPVWGLYANTCK